MKNEITQHELAVQVLKRRGTNMETGKGPIIPIRHFKTVGLQGPTGGNGGSWSRDSNWPGYKIRRWKMSDLKRERPEEAQNLEASKAFTPTLGTVAIQLCGLAKNEVYQGIRADIRQELTGQPSVFSGVTTTIEIDHKDGRKDNWDLDPSTQTLGMFQTVTKLENVMKRTECIRCEKTGSRYDAKSLGYPVSQTFGGPTYSGSCEGCYLYDPREFRSSLPSVLVRIK
jgi:hypothetical protein